MLKIRKGTEVRVRRTNQIGIIKEVELIRKGGRVHKYCHLITEDGKPNLWLDSDELTNIHEVCDIVFTNQSSGQKVFMVYDLNHKTSKMILRIKAENPENLQEHQGFHAALASLLVNQFLSNK